MAHAEWVQLDEPDEDIPVGALIVPPEARWAHIAGHIARRDDVKARMEEIRARLAGVSAALKNGKP